MRKIQLDLTTVTADSCSLATSYVTRISADARRNVSRLRSGSRAGCAVGCDRASCVLTHNARDAQWTHYICRLT